MLSEKSAREYLESILWPDGPVCPHCANREAYRLAPKASSKSPVRDGVYKCKACRRQFSVTVGTIFHGSRIGLAKWLEALRIIYEYDDIVIADFQIVLEVPYKTAWLLMNKIRFHRGNGEELEQYLQRIALSW